MSRKTKKQRKHKRKRKHKHKHTGKKTRKFVHLKCSPKTNNDKLAFTCYTRKSLHILKKIWNARHPDIVIKSNDPKEIWLQLKTYMQSSCNSEACWLRQQCIKQDINSNLWQETFAPKIPREWKKNPHEWLSSIEIEQVMKQWENSFSYFQFMGPSPIDYDKHLLFGECVWEELCKFSLINMKKRGKHKIGIIFNIDPHQKEGSHWVALFINMRKREIYYFDSYGVKIPRRIMKFVKKIQKQATSIQETYKFYETKQRHQYSISECGMFSLYFIIQMLQDKPFSLFQKKKITDKHMQRLRKIYFNNI